MDDPGPCNPETQQACGKVPQPICIAFLADMRMGGDTLRVALEDRDVEDGASWMEREKENAEFDA